MNQETNYKKCFSLIPVCDLVEDIKRFWVSSEREKKTLNGG